MFWMTPAARTRQRGSTWSSGVTSGRCEIQSQRSFSRTSSGALVIFSIHRFTIATLGKYGSIPAVLEDFRKQEERV